MKYSKNFLNKLYRTMLKIRFSEESFIGPILTGEVRCPVHLYCGQEAIATGVCAALKQDDYIFGTHRSHGHFLAKGGKLGELIAEVYGKENGCSRGRGGSMHVCAPEIGFLGAAPIVAGTISLALGASLASKIRKDRKVTVSFLGDGATGEGVLYESLNFSALRKLPIIFICENNFYSTHLHIRECRIDANIFKIAKPFGIPSFRIDGNNVLKVYETAKKAIEYSRKGKGPVFIECITYRLRGHVGPDDNIQGTHTDIRPKNEIASWLKRDPIINFAQYLLKNKICTIETLNKIKKEIDAEVSKSYSLVKKAQYPKESELKRHVFQG